MLKLYRIQVDILEKAVNSLHGVSLEADARLWKTLERLGRLLEEQWRRVGMPNSRDLILFSFKSFHFIFKKLLGRGC